MISRENYKSVRIHIVTYKEDIKSSNRHLQKMSEDKRHRNDSNRFICSVCLNSNKMRQELSKVTKCDLCFEKPKTKKREERHDFKSDTYIKNVNMKTVAVQTQETEINKSINLLNEVLTVFQNKKQSNTCNTVIFKDASISTENVSFFHKPRLQVSKLFQFSIDEVTDKSTIITSHDDILRSQRVIELPKYKSSSVPQIKCEETRNLAKDKPRDVVDEVNRMFGNVRRSDASDSNRPELRQGPRILPVVRPPDHVDKIWAACKCPIGDLSSGDSFVKAEKCNKKGGGETEKCVYMMCCVKNCRNMPADMMYCQCCKGGNFRSSRDRYHFDSDD